MLKIHYQRGIKIILLSGVLIFLMVMFSIGQADAGYTFASGKGKDKTGLELKIDSRAVYNGVLQPALTWDLKDLVPSVDKFFNFNDVKPGDLGVHTISLHVKKNSAYACLDFKNLVDEENGINEPEGLVDFLPEGELSQNLQFFAWRDDGDNVFEVGEKIVFGQGVNTADILLDNTTYPIADFTTGNSCAVNSVNYVGIMWCAGELTVNTNTAEVSCDGSGVGNIIQTDSMMVDVSLRAVQANQNHGFKCQKPEKPKPECKDKKGKNCEPKGDNGHGNDNDGNDDSNPGNSNDEDDYTDDDRVPPGQIDSELFERVSEARLWSNENRDSFRNSITSLLRGNN